MPSSKPVVLVTGCTPGGLGAELCKYFHARNCTVYATARSLSKIAELNSLGISTLEMDITKPPTIQEAVTRVTKDCGRIDILVNNAGAALAGSWLETDLDAVRSLFDVNLFGAVAVTQPVGKAMIHQRAGLIINIGSCAGWCHGPLLGQYSATKAALESFSNSLRMELKPFGVKVMHAAPGFFRSNLNSGGTKVAPTALYAPALGPFADYCAAQTSTDPNCPTSQQVAASIGAAALQRNPPRLWVGAKDGHAINFARRFVPTPVFEVGVMQTSRMDLLVKHLKETGQKVSDENLGWQAWVWPAAALAVLLSLLAALLSSNAGIASQRSIS